MDKIIVIGGLSAGPSAAAKARRENENAKIILFEKGENISYATCGIPYALSEVIESREDLIVVEPQLLRDRFKIDVRLDEKIIKIDPTQKKVFSTKGDYSYDKLVFASGASSIIPPIKGISQANNWSPCRSLNDFDKLKETLANPEIKNITILGAGLIGLEVAENLIEIGKNVTVIEGAKQILTLWDKKFAEFGAEILKSSGIKIITSTFVNEFGVENGKINKVFIDENNTIDTDFVVMSVGIKPRTELLTSIGAEHLTNGALKVNEFMETSIKDIYSAGDNTSIKNTITNKHDYFPLGTHSNKGGRAIGLNSTGSQSKFEGAYGTAIIKLFDYTLARTGMNKNSLEKNNIDYKSVVTIAGSTPGYYPDQKDLVSEIFYKPDTLEILGGEFFGEVGVDKRVDVLSTAIFAKLKITDLSKIDFAYAPPYSPAKDPLVVASFTAENIEKDKCNQLSMEDFEEFIKSNNIDSYSLIDVREKWEFDEGHINGAINLPLDELRDNLDKINKNKPIIIYCQRGLRGYLARLILHQNGFDRTSSLAGGYIFYSMCNPID